MSGSRRLPYPTVQYDRSAGRKGPRHRRGRGDREARRSGFRGVTIRVGPRASEASGITPSGAGMASATGMGPTRPALRHPRGRG